MTNFNYTIRVIDRQIQEIKEDNYPFMKFIVVQRLKELEAVKKILSEGTGYLGSTEHTEGKKIIFFSEL